MTIRFNLRERIITEIRYMVRRRKNRTIRGVMKIKTNLHDFAMVCYRKFHEFLLLLQDVDEFTFSVVS